MKDAIKQIETQPWVSLEVWGKAAGIGRNTAYKLASRGEIEGCFRLGAQYRVATAPWRRRLGLEGVAA